MSFTLGLFLAYFALLAVALVARGRAVSGPWLFLLRSFFPNWRFYHALGRAPRLEYRWTAGEDWSDWVRMQPRAPFRFANLLHNPAVNLALTEQNLVDHLAADIVECEGDDPSALVAYRLVERLAREKVAHLAPEAARFQFRIRSERPGETGLDDDDVVLLSPGLPA